MEGGQDNKVDFSLMDELLSSWSQTTELESDFLQLSSSNSTTFFNPLDFLPTISETLNPNSSQNNNQEERQTPILLPRVPTNYSLQTHQPLTFLEAQYSNSNSIRTQSKFYDRTEPNSVEGSFNLSSSLPSVKDRMVLALRHIRDTIKNEDVLIQIWVHVKREEKQFLITNDQLFIVSPSSWKLESYRNASMEYQFPSDGDLNESVGLRGRVFLGKVPEWTPDVRFFSSDEYKRIHFAQRYDVRGTIALPIFEQVSRSCLGIVEIVMNTRKINYRPELENVCRALEAVNLRGSESGSPTNTVKVPNVSYQAILPEIREVLRAACEALRLPLAQTWVQCILQGKEGLRHSDENYTCCISTVDDACLINDAKIQGFHEACSEHHLFRGQGITGRAFTTNQACFSSDITTFSKKDYPLSHYARMFGLRAAVAIRLRSIYTGMVDYVLEFFLPDDCIDPEEQKMILSSLSTIVQSSCQSLRVISNNEVLEDNVLSNSFVITRPSYGPNREQVPKISSTPLNESLKKESPSVTQFREVQLKGKSVLKEEPTSGFKVPSHWDNPRVVLPKGQPFREFTPHHQDSGPKENADSGGDSSLGESKFLSVNGKGEKRRNRQEKTISFQVLRQYFAGSLKDAAKSTGVCPTTLKRICRQHGINRWPARKIKKVGHSLKRLQGVIDSVQGIEGAFEIESIYPNLPDCYSPILYGTNPFSVSQTNDQISLNRLPNVQLDVVSTSPQATAPKSPSSSWSQSSHSSKKQQKIPSIFNIAGNEETTLMEETTTRQDDISLQENSQTEKLRHFEHPTLHNYPNHLPNSTLDRDVLRVKVTYGKVKVRFSMKLTLGFRHLQQEIAKRFYIDDMNKIDLKYLDDDFEWVLLTCDDDLEECLNIFKLSHQTQTTIKISVFQASDHSNNLGSSFPRIIQ